MDRLFFQVISTLKYFIYVFLRKKLLIFCVLWPFLKPIPCVH